MKRVRSRRKNRSFRHANSIDNRPRACLGYQTPNEVFPHFPALVVAEWLGNSVPVAEKHYLRITPSDFARAAAEPWRSAHSEPSKSDAETAEKAARNPAQQTAEMGGILRKIA